MGLKTLSILVMISFLLSCNSGTQSNTETVAQGDNSELTKDDIANLKYLEFTLDRQAETIAEPWDAYSRLREAVEGVKNADFSFFNAEEKASTELIKDLKATVPDTLNTPSVLSRILVMETMLQKMQETSGLSTTTKAELSQAVKDVLVAYSNLNFQLNKKLEKDKQNIQRPI
ncbi:hypothetical protein H7U19_07065 [Hyunsoonleella sp. SJ7]|uniref:Uncharacterized protein n=1 Tax=Hyunsoonleella aquatilis TaxID=2762758 RepID=A0A923HAJ9_9FLAO|nr:hypothetical protein [Hyunsoonleella aquatilis]MBC3758157.1 hypothetical protein [Hyunsoonleella aquatilis]